LRLAEERCAQAEGRCFAAERRRLDAERRLAEAELLLEQAREAGLRSRRLVVDLVALAAQLRASLQATPQPSAAAAEEDDAAAAERVQMADALAAAVERLRARLPVEDPTEPAAEQREPTAERGGRAAEHADAIALALARPRKPHRHSMSGIARWRQKRKQRKAR
jgi:hypothetical protein